MLKMLIAAGLFGLMVGCSSDQPYTLPAKPVTDSVELKWSAQIKPLTDKYCVSCHGSADFVKSGAGYLAGGAKGRVANNNMPLAGSAAATAITAADRATLAGFTGQ